METKYYDVCFIGNMLVEATDHDDALLKAELRLRAADSVKITEVTEARGY